MLTTGNVSNVMFFPPHSDSAALCNHLPYFAGRSLPHGHRVDRDEHHAHCTHFRPLEHLSALTSALTFTYLRRHWHGGRGSVCGFRRQYVFHWARPAAELRGFGGFHCIVRICTTRAPIVSFNNYAEIRHCIKNPQKPTSTPSYSR